MAIISNMYNENRVNLGEEIPLSTPFVIQIEASGFCNLRCSFCPVNDDTTQGIIQKDMMTFDTFKLIVDSCSEFQQKIKVLRIIGIGEPLLNKDLPDFIQYSKNSGHFEKIEVVTNGILLEPELGDKLVSAGLDVLKISLLGLDAESYFTFAKTQVNTDAIYKNLKDFFRCRNNCGVYIKILKRALKTELDEHFFYERFGQISDYIYIEEIIENWPEFYSGAVTEVTVRFGLDQYQTTKNICIQPFLLMCVAANGDIMPCSVDWKRSLLLDNINQSHSLLSVWNIKTLFKLRTELLTEHRNSFCSSCNYSINCQADSIDNYKDKILSRICK